MTLDFTVAIPVYNGAERITRVIEHLQCQTNTESLSWEILVVDNNSDDGLDRLIQALQSTWKYPFPLHYLHEPQQGITYARACAVQAARGKSVGFLDDDNFADPTWVASAHAFGEQYPDAGAYGGQIRAECAVPPPPSFEAVKGFLVIRSLGDQPQRFNPKRLQLPAGAGLVIRKQAWLESMPRHMIRTEVGGNDYEISLHMHNHGWDIWYTPAMVITHQISVWRMETSYLRSLAHLHGLCTCELQMIVTPRWQRPFVLAKNFLGGLKRLSTHVIKHRKTLRTELAASCKLAFHIGNVLSPGFYLKNAIRRFFGRFGLNRLSETHL